MSTITVRLPVKLSRSARSSISAMMRTEGNAMAYLGKSVRQWATIKDTAEAKAKVLSLLEEFAQENGLGPEWPSQNPVCATRALRAFDEVASKCHGRGNRDLTLARTSKALAQQEWRLRLWTRSGDFSTPRGDLYRELLTLIASGSGEVWLQFRGIPLRVRGAGAHTMTEERARVMGMRFEIRADKMYLTVTVSTRGAVGDQHRAPRVAGENRVRDVRVALSDSAAIADSEGLSLGIIEHARGTRRLATLVRRATLPPGRKARVDRQLMDARNNLIHQYAGRLARHAAQQGLRVVLVDPGATVHIRGLTPMMTRATRTRIVEEIHRQCARHHVTVRTEGRPQKMRATSCEHREDVVVAVIVGDVVRHSCESCAGSLHVVACGVLPSQ